MVFDVHEVSGIGDFSVLERTVGEGDDAEKVLVYMVAETDGSGASGIAGASEVSGGRAFLVVRKNTLEVRTDRKLLNVLREKYESVMESRYFGRGGIEIVNSGQLTQDEIDDLVRLSYNLSQREN